MFRNLCQFVHKDLVAGTCPWCGRAIINGQVFKRELSAHVAMLTTLLKDKNGSIRCGAADRLGRIGPDAKSAIPALSELLNDENEDIRKAASEALEKIQKDK